MKINFKSVLMGAIYGTGVTLIPIDFTAVLSPEDIIIGNKTLPSCIDPRGPYPQPVYPCVKQNKSITT